ncbi:hypothetical protein A6A04_03055 [Paramagnetospirillum marisnigri]|uniref:Uncharacterized protein n=1 Tax=Paramagnetospirillum marisnigri TaxID=1285242 RepID=A0A178MMF6_9PROT|nr:mitofilin family membrane protein [Paramagnetospirillum marisnigri]OAN49114.1 hypothetical protein A6A04_03055 [Paramagnetospirillum marisnigri]
MTTDSADPILPTPSPVPPTSSGSRGVVAVLLLGMAAAAGVLSFPLWRDKVGLPVQPTGFEVEDLRAEVSGLALRLAQVEARPTVSSAAPAAATPGDDGRLNALEQALKAVQAQPAVPATLTAEVDSISKQLADLRRTSADAAALMRLADRLEQVDAGLRDLQAKRSSAAVLLLGVGQLREAVELGRGFDAEWRAVKVLAGDESALAAVLEPLKDKAVTGIRTRSALTDSFQALAPAVIRAEVLPEGEGWQRRVVDKMLSLVTIRREDGSAAGANAAAVVGRAQAALARADLAAAAAELEALGTGPAETAAPWLAEARARLAAEKAVSELTAQVLALAGAKP